MGRELSGGRGLCSRPRWPLSSRQVLAFFAVIGLSVAALAQTDDATYCANLGRLAAKFVGGAGGDGNKGPDLNTLGAMTDCRNGKYAKGLAYLEKRLLDAHVTLPPR